MYLLADGPWYATSTSLAVEGLVAAVVLGLVAIWATFRSQNPRQELVFQVRSVVPLLTRDALDDNDVVELSVNGHVLDNPQTVEVRLRNRGQRDIPTAAFDQGRPFRLDVGVPIVSIRRSTSAPAEFSAPRIEIDGSALSIGPDLLKKGQAVTVSVLVDGTDVLVAAQGSPFIDIAVREDRSDDAAQVAGTALTALKLIVGSVLAILVAGAGWVSVSSGSQAPPMAVATATAAATVAATVLVRRRRSRS